MKNILHLLNIGIFYRSSILITKKKYYYNTFSSFENNTRNIFFYKLLN